jgi:hypothetical protein
MITAIEEYLDDKVVHLSASGLTVFRQVPQPRWLSLLTAWDADYWVM